MSKKVVKYLAWLLAILTVLSLCVACRVEQDDDDDEDHDKKESTVVRCDGCGAKNQEDATFCRKCGTRLAEDTRPDADEPLPPDAGTQGNASDDHDDGNDTDDGDHEDRPDGDDGGHGGIFEGDEDVFGEEDEGTKESDTRWDPNDGTGDAETDGYAPEPEDGMRCPVCGPTCMGHLCGYCYGNGGFSCLVCNGNDGDCDHCRGMGYTSCTVCNGKGYVYGAMPKDEYMCQECTTAGTWVCLGHGCAPCEGTGVTWCDQCAGAGCGSCYDNGMVICATCQGRGHYFNDRPVESCPDCPSAHGCNGHTCANCRGIGEISCPVCLGEEGNPCEACEGYGILTCMMCGGRGTCYNGMDVFFSK